MADGVGGGGREAPLEPSKPPEIERPRAAVEELYRARDTFFPSDPAEKSSRLCSLADDALALLLSVPEEERKSTQQRAIYELLHGKVLDIHSNYCKEAEEHLSKAVKLNPSLIDAWLCLGNCIWKRGDLEGAKNCYLLALTKGRDKKILCQLSMLERSMCHGAENNILLVDESIKHAKEAVVLDISDGNSWYNLGNAYLTSFFVSGTWDHTRLQHSVKAYQNAEKDDVVRLNPDLCFNFATANKYLENYERALSGFEAAALIDPSLDADKEVKKIVVLLDRLENALKGFIRSKKMASITSSLGEVKIKSPHRSASISILSEGLNKQVAVVGKVLLFVRHDNVAPLYYLACDLEQSYFIISAYGINLDAIKEGDHVTLLDPYYRLMDISWKGKNYHYKSIRVDFPQQILVNDKTPAHHDAVRASIRAKNRP